MSASNIELDQDRLRAILEADHSYHTRDLSDCCRYLLLDGIVLEVKGEAQVRRRVVLCAYGITDDGVRELIDFRQVSSESEAMWTAFLDSLYRRGLSGDRLDMVSTDGVPWSAQRPRHRLPFLPRQRCWAHKMRNVTAKLPRKLQDACLAEAKTIYQAHTRREAPYRTRIVQW